MHINIFDSYNEFSKKLIKTFDTVGIERKNLFVQYEGEMPEGSYNPFCFFTKIEDNTIDIKCLFFNKVRVPDFCDIRHIDGRSASIEFCKKKIGGILYRKEGYRLVDYVDWFSEENSKVVIKRDFYNKSGIHYATTYFSDKVPYLKEYYNLNSEVIISENLLDRTIQLKYSKKLYFFENLTHFFVFFLKILKIEITDLYINSLSFPLFISHELRLGKCTTLFWQEQLGESVPGNMHKELVNPISLRRIIFMDISQLNQVKESYPNTTVKLNYLSYLGEFTRRNQFRLQALIVTNSDNIYGLEEILTNFPSLQVTVAAHSNMSNKLLDMDGIYTNIHLMPSITEEELKIELTKSDIYLDINNGIKVGDILKKVYENNMIIFSYKEVFIPEVDCLVFREVRDLCNNLSYILKDKLNWIKLLKKMIEQHGPLSSISDYIKVLHL